MLAIIACPYRAQTAFRLSGPFMTVFPLIFLLSIPDGGTTT